MRRLVVGSVLRAMFPLLLDVRLLLGASLWFCLLLVAAFIEDRFPNLPLAAFVLSTFAVVAIAVRTHRHVLLQEDAKPARLSGIEFDYVLRAIRVYLPFFLFILAAVIAIVIAFVAAGYEIRPPSLLYRIAMVGVFVFLTGLLVTPRALSLPAIAIGEKGFSVTQSSDVSEGNGAQLLTLTAVALLSPVAVAEFVGLVVGSVANGGYGILEPLAATIMLAATTILWASMLSFSYAGLVQGDMRFAREAVREQPAPEISPPN